MAYGLAMTQGAGAERTMPCPRDAPAFDAAEFDELVEMIGSDGVMEMVGIFEAETRSRLRRLEAGGQDRPTQLREMHTLKGAAGSVAAPRLTTLGETFERAARTGIMPTRDDISMIATALEAYLSAMRAWARQRAQAA
jgi:HPt (histidine-containing phosphotransfer) domain-containing protein